MISQKTLNDCSYQIVKYLQELKTINGSKLILEMARLGSQKAMDAIIENLVTYIYKYNSKSNSLFEKYGNIDEVTKVIKKDLYKTVALFS